MEKRFREDLLARINLWTFEMPGLSKRPEDIEPNLNYELDRFAERTKRHITFNKEARNRFLKFATSPEALWPANFRDLNGAITRMATLAPGGRITDQVVKDEIHRLSLRWGFFPKQRDDGILVELIGEERTAALDRFEKIQLADVIRICRTSKNIAQAGRTLFAASRKRKTRSNDSDRLRKYLSKYQIQWREIHS
jgi:transcriptional regulatory protein RtcR